MPSQAPWYHFCDLLPVWSALQDVFQLSKGYLSTMNITGPSCYNKQRDSLSHILVSLGEERVHWASCPPVSFCALAEQRPPARHTCGYAHKSSLTYIFSPWECNRERARDSGLYCFLCEHYISEAKGVREWGAYSVHRLYESFGDRR